MAHIPQRSRICLFANRSLLVIPTEQRKTYRINVTLPQRIGFCALMIPLSESNLCAALRYTATFTMSANPPASKNISEKSKVGISFMEAKSQNPIFCDRSEPNTKLVRTVFKSKMAREATTANKIDFLFFRILLENCGANTK